MRLAPLAALPLTLAGCHNGLLPARPDLAGTSLQARADRVAGEVAQLRGLELKAAVPVEERTKEQFRERTAQQVAADWEDSGALEQRTYKILGLLPRDFELKEFLPEFGKEQIAGYYDPQQQRFFTIADRDSATGKSKQAGSDNEAVLLSHELTHALEDQHFDLRALHEAAGGSTDRALALAALIEGSAMNGCLDHAFDRAGVHASSASPLGRFSSWAVAEKIRKGDRTPETGSHAVADEAPSVIGQTLLFKYADGLEFTNELRADFGWRGIDAAFRDPPESTEQVLRPERYFDRRDRPVVIEPCAPPEGWNELRRDTLGMFVTRLLLESRGAKKPFAAEGWDGDCCLLYATPGGDAVGWVTAWDLEGEAETFQRRVEPIVAATERALGSHAIARVGKVVALVLDAPAGAAAPFAQRLAEESAIAEAPDDQQPERWYWKALRFPIGVRLLDHAWETHALGGLAFDLRSAEGGHRFTILKGAALHTESTPDRHGVWLALGMLGWSHDARLDYTFWQIPYVATGHFRGEGAAARSSVSLLLESIDWGRSGPNSHFDLLWSLLLDLRFGPDADDDGFSARVLLIPIA